MLPDNFETNDNMDIITVLDEFGKEHQFELVDAIESEKGRFVALFPIYDNASELVDDDGELIILAVADEDGEDVLVPIEDDDIFDAVANEFEERLSDLFEIEEVEGSPEDLN